MTLEHPALAYGALLGAVPPLLHLLDRRKPRAHPFAAIDFVLRAQRGGQRRFRLKRILLMAARMALLIAIPLALARPSRTASASALQSVTGPRATALVLDGSGSMRYRKGRETLFHKAQDQAKARLRLLSAEDPVTVVLCAPRAPNPRPPGNDHLALLAQLDSDEPSLEPVDLAGCLESAAHALAASEVPGKRILVFSDLQQANWSLSEPAPTIATAKGPVHPELEFIDVAEGELPNHALSNLDIVPAPALGPHAFQFSVMVHNFSSQPVQDVPVALEAEGKIVARGFCDIGAYGSERKVLGASFPAGATTVGRVFLPEDNLAEDDAIPFVLPVPRQARALILDGSPSSLRYLDEAFFLQTALEASAGAVSVRTQDPESATADTFDNRDLDVVALLNVRQLPKESVAGLRRFVEQGGGLLVALGDKVDAEALNDNLGNLLPVPLRLVKTAVLPPHATDADADADGANGPGGTLTAQSPSHFGQVSASSSLFSGFASGTREGLLDTRIYRYFLVEPPKKDAEVLASFDDGAPALLLAARKAGRVMLFTSSLAREWTDWPIRASFVPVMQQAVRLLAHLEEQTIPQPVLVGSTAAPRHAGWVATGLRSPSGKELRLGTEARALDELGLWHVRWTDASNVPLETRVGDLPVVFDPRESDLRRVDPHELSAHFGGVVRAESVTPAGLSSSIALWTELLIAGVIFFASEALLGA